MMDKTVVRKGRISEQGNDFLFWKSRSFIDRLAALEEIRQEYILWKYAAEQRLQRVFESLKAIND
jgi:hypothetical protein